MRKLILMRKLFVVLSIICLLFIVSVAQAADVVLKAKIQSVTVAIDKNGNQYVRFIVDETRKMQGVEYEVGVAVMAFRGTVKEAKAFKDGDILKAICSERVFQGRKSYTILKLLPK